MHRMLGIPLLVVALAGLVYGWFALPWDGGTNRVTGDRVLIGLSVVLAIGGWDRGPRRFRTLWPTRTAATAGQ